MGASELPAKGHQSPSARLMGGRQQRGLGAHSPFALLEPPDNKVWSQGEE